MIEADIDLAGYRLFAKKCQQQAGYRGDSQLRYAAGVIRELIGRIAELLRERQRLERERDTAQFNCRELEDRLAEFQKGSPVEHRQ